MSTKANKKEVSKTGRPTKYREGRIDRILENLREGGTRSTAVTLGGITRETFYQWLRQKPGFEMRVLQAEAQAEIAMVKALFDAASAGNWRASLFWLEHMHPEEWGRHPAKSTVCEYEQCREEADGSYQIIRHSASSGQRSLTRRKRAIERTLTT